ncbi:MAG: ZIP family metal transporter [Eubacteriales bacterium]
MKTLLFAAIGCMFPFIMTVFGASAVFLFRKDMKPVFRQVFLGFAAGVMLAASVWSLLNPAIAAAESLGVTSWIPAAGGLAIGVLFLLFSDIAVTRLVSMLSDTKTILPNDQKHCTFLLQLAMTLHNIPEGMAVGLSFALAAETAGNVGNGISFIGVSVDTNAFYAAAALALGIGIQNFPEGAAVSLPLRQDGMPASKAFLRGCLSGIVEPVFGILTVVLLGKIRFVMPWLLSFAAGAMLYVVAEELIPSANGKDMCERDRSFIGTLSIMTGFILMMILDVALG